MDLVAIISLEDKSYLKTIAVLIVVYQRWFDSKKRREIVIVFGNIENLYSHVNLGSMK